MKGKPKKDWDKQLKDRLYGKDKNYHTSVRHSSETPEYMTKLEEAAKPLLKLLDEDYSPHTTVIINSRNVQLVEGKISIGMGRCIDMLSCDEFKKEIK